MAVQKLVAAAAAGTAARDLRAARHALENYCRALVSDLVGPHHKGVIVTPVVVLSAIWNQTNARGPLR